MRILENVLHNFVAVVKLKLIRWAETKNAYRILMGGGEDHFENISAILYVNRIRDRWNWLQIVFSGEVWHSRC
jgi:hypothetical protein